MRILMVCCVVFFTTSQVVVSQTQQSPRELTVDLGGGVKLELILIPSGQFMMGDEEGYPVEKPVHKVAITKLFYLGKYVVTQRQWLAVIGTKTDLRGGEYPVGAASYDDCQVFLKKLDAMAATHGNKFVLPTEAQWEYACRAGSTTKYCFGANEGRLGDYAWYKANSGRLLHPVGASKPNALGLYDMHGNVSQWCEDWYDPKYYAESPANDPQGPSAGTHHVIRGGSWDRDAWVCRSAFRCYGVPQTANAGFRVARVSVE